MTVSKQTSFRANGFVMFGYALVLLALFYGVNWPDFMKGSSPYNGLAGILIMPIVGVAMLVGFLLFIYGLSTFAARGARDKASLIITFGPLGAALIWATAHWGMKAQALNELERTVVNVSLADKQFNIPIGAPVSLKVKGHNDIALWRPGSNERPLRFKARDKTLLRLKKEGKLENVNTYSIGWNRSGDPEMEQYPLLGSKSLIFTTDLKARGMPSLIRDVSIASRLKTPEAQSNGILTWIELEEKRSDLYAHYLYGVPKNANDWELFICIEARDREPLTCFAQIDLGGFWAVHEHESFRAQPDEIADRYLAFRSEVHSAWDGFFARYGVDDN